MELKNFLPPPNEILELEPEEVASFLLEYLCTMQENSGRGLNVGSFNGLSLHNNVLGHPLTLYASGHNSDEIVKLLTEAWCWLEKEVMLASQPGQQPRGNFVYVTKKGFKYRNKIDLENYRKGGLLPKDSLDNKLVEKVYSLFLRGDYDTAVFQAFKEVEVRVRKKAGLPETVYGVDLVRTAFNVQNGKLTNMLLVPSERQAMSDLFAGCIGSFKNPSSHRNVDLDNPSEAAEIILFANYLLRLVDRFEINE